MLDEPLLCTQGCADSMGRWIGDGFWSQEDLGQVLVLQPVGSVNWKSHSGALYLHFHHQREDDVPTSLVCCKKEHLVGIQQENDPG